MGNSDFAAILNAMPETGVYVIRASDHSLLYFSARLSRPRTRNSTRTGSASSRSRYPASSPSRCSVGSPPSSSQRGCGSWSCPPGITG